MQVSCSTLHFKGSKRNIDLKKKNQTSTRLFWFELSRVKLYRNDLKGDKNYFKLAGGSSYCKCYEGNPRENTKFYLRHINIVLITTILILS